MTLSVVIPTFNRADMLKRALKSIVMQDCKPDEVIVSDNASTDNTGEVLSGFEGCGFKLTYSRHPENVGMLKNWEHAISLVKTDQFLILADDDYLLPGCLRAAREAFSTIANLGMWCGITVCVDKSLNPKSIAPAIITVPKALSGLELLTFPMRHPGSTGTVFSREAFERVGGFRRESAYLADLSIMLRIASRFKVSFTPKPVAVYSASSTYRKVNFFDSWYPGCLDIFAQLKIMNVHLSIPYQRYLGRSVFLSFLAIYRNIRNKTASFRRDLRLLLELRKFIRLPGILFIFTEGIRYFLWRIRRRYFRSQLDEFFQRNAIKQLVYKVNQ